MILRRLLTIPGYLVAWLLWLLAAPLWIPLALVVDAVRRSRGVAIRTAAMVTVYLTCEVLGIVVSASLWLWRCLFRMDEERWTDLHFRVEAWWGATLFHAVSRLFGLRLEIDCDTDLGRGPYLLLLRHTSLADTLLASALVAKPHGLRLRYVLKRELLWDPCLDIVGNRVPNVFLDRFSNDMAGQIRGVQELTRDLGPHDGILIYPEGTRFSPAKRARMLERFQQTGDQRMDAYARSLSFVLPPRIGGTLGLLDAAPEMDVVFCAHTGFEGAATWRRVWQGALLHRRVQVQFRRVPREDVPTERDLRIAWILQEWQQVGAWVESHQASRSS